VRVGVPARHFRGSLLDEMVVLQVVIGGFRVGGAFSRAMDDRPNSSTSGTSCNPLIFVRTNAYYGESGLEASAGGDLTTEQALLSNLAIERTTKAPFLTPTPHGNA